jgi:hypothetical protein
MPLPTAGELHMAEKKTSSRFCIKFNENDARHLQVMEILNAQGRHKAQFIATAILHYIYCRETSAIPQDDARLRQTVETIVLEVLAKRDTPMKQGTFPADKQYSPKSRKSSEIGLDDVELDSETIRAIHDSLTAFRSTQK